MERALSILEALGANPEGVGVTRLGKELGLHKSTVHRLLATLSRYGFVEQDEATECYRLGMRFVSLGLNFLHQLDFRREVLPHLKELAEITGEMTQLGVLEGNEILYLERFQSQETITVNLGLRLPAHCTAEGKVLLGCLPDDRLQEFLAKEPLRQFTINTIINPEQLMLHIAAPGVPERKHNRATPKRAAARVWKRREVMMVDPNLANYEDTCRSFTWEGAEAALGLVPGCRFNIARAAVDANRRDHHR